MILKNTIRVERAKKRVSQGELAGAVNMTVQAIGNIENGANLKLINACLIAKYFGLKIEELFKLEEEGKNEEN